MTIEPWTATGLPAIHPGELLREDILPALARPRVEIARLLGVSRQALHAVLAERASVTPEMALRLGKLCGNGPELWFALQTRYDLERLRREKAADIDAIPTLRPGNRTPSAGKGRAADERRHRTAFCGRLQGRGMIEFARNTPPEVANWIRAELAAVPNHPILRALATDERMSALWPEFAKWQPGALAVVQLAMHFSTPTILSVLQKPSEERGSLSWPEYQLGVAAENFAVELECWRSAATELWAEPVDALIERLRAFATTALERAKAKQSVYDYIPEPSRRGRGIEEQLAFREALSRALQRLSEHAPLSKGGQDRIIATIASVVFPERPVDVETIRTYRIRQQRRQKVGDN